MLFKKKDQGQCVNDSMICFDPKMVGKDRVHGAALRFVEKMKEDDMRFDIEVAGLLHLFVKACGVTQEELDTVYKKIDIK